MVAGEGSQDALDAVRKKALELGAADAVLIDARERFITDYAYPRARRERAAIRACIRSPPRSRAR